MTEPFTERVDAAVSATAAKARLAGALAKLPASQRDALLLYAWAELSYEQIATATGVPMGTVQSRISRARQRLRKQLADLNPATTQQMRRPASERARAAGQPPRRGPGAGQRPRRARGDDGHPGAGPSPGCRTAPHPGCGPPATLAANPARPHAPPLAAAGAGRRARGSPWARAPTPRWGWPAAREPRCPSARQVVAWSGQPTAPWPARPSYGRAGSATQLVDFATRVAAAPASRPQAR